MFRILLADDEGIMLESLKNIITSNFGSNCEIRCVKTGRAVVEQAESFHPDIAFVDIHMPGLSGIQAIQEIRKFDKEMVVIIITAYDKFKYAQEAVNLGVMEYLTKPIANRNVILDACRRAMRQVEEARQRRDTDLKIREKLEIVRPIIESGFIYSLIQDEGDVYQHGYKEILGVSEDSGFCVVFEMGDSEEAGVMTNAVGAGVRASRRYSMIVETIKDYFSCIVGPLMGNRVVIFVPTQEQKNDYERRVEVLTRTRNLVHQLEDAVDSRFRGGIGSVMPIGEARESYREALKALRESGSHIAHIADIPAVREYYGEYPLDLENEYYKRGLSADAAGTTACANELFDWMAERYSDYRADIEIKVLELVMQLEYRAFFNGGVKYGFRYRENYIREIQTADNLEELRRWFVGKTRDICEHLVSGKKRESENLVEQVKTYIDRNFQKDLSLDEVSRMVNISPYYFSKLFKQGTGENFIEYLTRVRMEHARRLLEDPDASIKQVCVMSGYGDPNYFSRLFKKYEGVTPSEYRERFLNG